MAFIARLAAIDAIYGLLNSQVRQLREGGAHPPALTAIGEMLDFVASVTDPGMAQMVRDLVGGGRAAVSNMFKTRRACLLLLAGEANIVIALRAEDLLRVSVQHGRHLVELIAAQTGASLAGAAQAGAAQAGEAQASVASQAGVAPDGFISKPKRSAAPPPVFTILARPTAAAALTDLAALSKPRARGSRGGVRHNGGRARQTRGGHSTLPPMGLDTMDRILADAVNAFSAPVGGPSYLTALLAPPPVRPKSEAAAAPIETAPAAVPTETVPAETALAETALAETALAKTAPNTEPAAAAPAKTGAAQAETAPAEDKLVLPPASSWGSDSDDEDIFEKRPLPKTPAVAKPPATPATPATPAPKVTKRAPRAKKV